MPEHHTGTLASTWRHWTNAACVACFCLAMAGCSLLGSKEDILPQDGPTMREVYDGHFGKTPSKGRHKGEPLGQGPGEGTGHLAGYTRDTHTEIQALFPQLPNPPLVMYVFPHLNGNGRPVPGYATSFPFYEKTEYALPGESGGHP